MVENGCVLDRQCALRLSRYVSVYVIWLTLSWCDWIMVWIISNPLETTWSNSTHSFCPISTDFLLKMKDIHQKINQIQVIYFMHDPNIEQIIGKLIQTSWNSIIVTKARNPNCIHFVSWIQPTKAIERNSRANSYLVRTTPESKDQMKNRASLYVVVLRRFVIS